MRVLEGHAALARHLRVVSLGLSVMVIAIVGTWEAFVLTLGFTWDLFGDYWFFRSIAERWVETGALYGAHQLDGPYAAALQVDNLYPPHALLLFLPMLVLPAVLWWIVPIGITAWVIAWLRPAWWSWPLLALLAVWPKTVVAVIWGNTDLWIIAFVAAGFRWGWPAALVSVKPVFLPLAVIGVRSRSFWVAIAALAASVVVMLPLWLDYVTAMRNLTISPTYSLWSVPSFLLPIAAWLVRRRDGVDAPPGVPVSVGPGPIPVAAGSTPAVGDRP